MKRLLFTLVIITLIGSANGQENLNIDRYLLVNIENMKNSELETHEVPEGEVWSMESVLTDFETKSVFFIMDDVEYHLPFGEVRRSVCLPFYLPSGTKFQLGAKEGPAIVSIRVLVVD